MSVGGSGTDLALKTSILNAEVSHPAPLLFAIFTRPIEKMLLPIIASLHCGPTLAYSSLPFIKDNDCGP